MAQEERNRLIEWYLLIREQAPVVRQRLEQWAQAVREEPALLWNTPAVRVATYVLGGLITLWMLTWAVNLAVPPQPASARPEATTADFHVICVNETCNHHFVVHREFGFRGFPVVCPQCQQETGLAARRCNSRACNGRWVAPLKSDSRLTCPQCGGVFE